MSVYHLNVKTGSRSGGQSAMAKDQYIEREGKYAGKDNIKKSDVEIVMSGNMPDWAKDHHEYWKAADQHERVNGRLYKEVEFALPVEITRDNRGKVAKEFAEYLTGKEHLPYTLAIHIDDVNNPHCHLMISERMNDGIERSPDQWFARANTKNPSKGGAKKSESLKPKDWLLNTREAWAAIANSYLDAEQAIDHRTLKEQGIDREPTKHRGVHRKAKEYYQLEIEIKQRENELLGAIKELNELREKRQEAEKQTPKEAEREQKSESVSPSAAKTVAPIGGEVKKPEPKKPAEPRKITEVLERDLEKLDVDPEYKVLGFMDRRFARQDVVKKTLGTWENACKAWWRDGGPKDERAERSESNALKSLSTPKVLEEVRDFVVNDVVKNLREYETLNDAQFMARGVWYGIVEEPKRNKSFHEGLKDIQEAIKEAWEKEYTPNLLDAHENEKLVERDEITERDRRIAELDNKLNNPPYWIGSAGYTEREAVSDVRELVRLASEKLRDESDGKISQDEESKAIIERYPVILRVQQKLGGIER